MRAKPLTYWLARVLAGAFFLFAIYALGPYKYFAKTKCPYSNCDFFNHYLPMAKLIFLKPKPPVEGYLYPPFVALALAPLAKLPAHIATYAWLALHFILILPAVALTQKCVGKVGRVSDVAFFTMLFGLSNAFWEDMRWGQISFMVILLLLWGGWLASQGQNLLAGLLVGLAVAMKLYPCAIFILWLLERRWRAIAWGVAFSAVFLFFIPAALLGTDYTLYSIRYSLSSYISSNPPYFASYRNSHDLVSAFLRWSCFARLDTDLLTSPYRWRGVLFGMPCGLVLKISYLLLALVSVALWACIFKSLRANPAAAIQRAMLVFLWIFWLGQTTWTHYYIFLPLALALWDKDIQQGGEGVVSQVGYLIALALISGPVVWVFDPVLYHRWGIPFLASAVCGAWLCKSSIHQAQGSSERDA